MALQRSLGLSPTPAPLEGAGQPIIPRPYQLEVIDALFAWWGERPGDFPLVVLPTASGKTIVFALLIKRIQTQWPAARVLVLAHRQELLEQAECKILSVWPEAQTGVYCAGLGRLEVEPITIASRDSFAHTAQRAREVLDEHGGFDLVIVDEAHNIGRDEQTRYQYLIHELQRVVSHVMVVGFTATPYRSDAGYIYGPDEVFKGVAYEKSIREMVLAGYLAPPRAVATEANIDTAGLRTVAGDFNKKQLGERAAKADLVDAQLDQWEKHAIEPLPGRDSTVFFCVNIEHATIVHERASARGYDVPLIHGGTPKVERARALAAFESGEVPGIANVGVLTEGWDAPRLDCIALMRPTKSLGLFIQMVGRGLRPSPETGKTDCLILDFGGCLQRFGPIDRARPAKTRTSVVTRVKECPSCSTLCPLAVSKCEHCGYVWEIVTKLCETCGAENRMAAAQCECCGAILLSEELEKAPSSSAVISGQEENEREIVRYEVEAVRCVAFEAKSGNYCLRVMYDVVDDFTTYSQILCLGYGGFAGRKAEGIAKRAVLPQYGEIFPRDPVDFETCHEGVAGGILKTPLAIYVDMASQWKDVQRVEYAEG